jgi:H+/gluconate symporter-like permease
MSSILIGFLIGFPIGAIIGYFIRKRLKNKYRSKESDNKIMQYLIKRWYTPEEMEERAKKVFSIKL